LLAAVAAARERSVGQRDLAVEAVAVAQMPMEDREALVLEAVAVLALLLLGMEEEQVASEVQLEMVGVAELEWAERSLSNKAAL